MDSRDDALRVVEAHARYRVLREVAFQETRLAADAVGLSPQVRITDLSPWAIVEWRRTWRRRHWTGDGGFPWDLLSRRYRQKPRAFHAAVWAGSSLCGLSVGWVSAGHRNVTLHFMESAPDPEHLLRGEITYLVFTAAEFYGRALGARRLILRNPLEGVRARYRAFGFTLVAGESRNLYYYKEIT